jgi:hypothetical protein
MRVPVLVEEIKFEEGVSAMAASFAGDKIAVATKGILGVYELKRGDGKTRLSHLASFVIPGDKEYSVTSVCFNQEGDRLHIRAEDGFDRELSLTEKRDGMMVELSRTPIETTGQDYALAQGA